jgi:hypothetical protein
LYQQNPHPRLNFIGFHCSNCESIEAASNVFEQQIVIRSGDACEWQAIEKWFVLATDQALDMTIRLIEPFIKQNGFQLFACNMLKRVKVCVAEKSRSTLLPEKKGHGKRGDNFLGLFRY